MSSDDSKTDDPMRIWNAVCTTDPAFTKDVSYGARKFTSVNAQHQIMEATKLWGPYGSTWGVQNIQLTFSPKWGAVVMQANFWYPGGGFDMVVDGKFEPGQDAMKKCHTDLTKKALSKLGFSADIHTGQWDDDKYHPAPTGQSATPSPATNQYQQGPPAQATPEQMQQHGQPLPQAPSSGGKIYPTTTPSQINRLLAIARGSNYSFDQTFYCLKVATAGKFQRGLTSGKKGDEFKEAIGNQLQSDQYDWLTGQMEQWVPPVDMGDGNFEQWPPLPQGQQSDHERLTQGLQDASGGQRVPSEPIMDDSIPF